MRNMQVEISHKYTDFISFVCVYLQILEVSHCIVKIKQIKKGLKLYLSFKMKKQELDIQI